MGRRKVPQNLLQHVQTPGFIQDGGRLVLGMGTWVCLAYLQKSGGVSPQKIPTACFCSPSMSFYLVYN